MRVALDVSDQAAFYRAALWLGLVRGAEVVAWAESLLVAAPDAPARSWTSRSSMSTT